MDKYTEDTTLEKILESGKAEEVLAEFSVPCLTCPMMQKEASELKIGNICEMYGINKEKLLEKLNQK